MAGTCFRIHLSTAIALMLAAGMLMWANLTPGKRSVSIGPQRDQENDVVYKTYGWPLYTVFDSNVRLTNATKGQPRRLQFFSDKKDVVLFTDTVVALVILIFVHIAFETIEHARTARARKDLRS